MATPKKIKAAFGELEDGIKAAIKVADEGHEVDFTYDYAGRDLRTKVWPGDTARAVRKRLFA